MMKGLEKQEIMWRKRDVYLQIEVELEMNATPEGCSTLGQIQ